MQHAASTTKSLPGRDECRTAKVHKAHLSWSSAAEEGWGVQKPFLCEGSEQSKLNCSFNSTQGAAYVSAALCLFFVLIIKITQTMSLWMYSSLFPVLMYVMMRLITRWWISLFT